MWSAFARQIAAYAITRRGKKLFALVGALLLCFGTTLLIDMQLCASAGFSGVLALLAVAAWLSQHVKLKRRLRERQERMAEEAIRRAARARARSEQIVRSKAAVNGAFSNAARAASDAASGTARFFAGAAAEMAREVTDAYGDVTRSVSGALDGAAQVVAGGTASLKQTWRTTWRDALAYGLALFARASEAVQEPHALPERRLAPHVIPRIGLRTDLNA
jgi:hypothetical protein